MKIHKLMEGNPNFGSGNVRLLKFKGQLTITGLDGFEGFHFCLIRVSGKDGVGGLCVKNLGPEGVSKNSAGVDGLSSGFIDHLNDGILRALKMECGQMSDGFAAILVIDAYGKWPARELVFGL